MSLNLSQFSELGSENTLTLEKHILFVLSEKMKNNIPYAEMLQSKLKRTNSEFKDLNKTPVSLDLPNGGVASFVVLVGQLNMFQRHTLLRKAVSPLLAEHPTALAICVFGDEAAREANACAAYYVATVNAAELPSRKKENKSKPLKSISIHGVKTEHNYGNVNARVAGNMLCRQLTMTPPNE